MNTGLIVGWAGHPDYSVASGEWSISEQEAVTIARNIQWPITKYHDSQSRGEQLDVAKVWLPEHPRTRPVKLIPGYRIDFPESGSFAAIDGRTGLVLRKSDILLPPRR